jgi:hypothetical protein
MEEISMIELDIAKSMFRGHGVDSAGEAFIRRQSRA